MIDARAIAKFLPRSRFVCAVVSAGSLFLIYLLLTGALDAFDGHTRLRRYGMISGWQAYLCGVSRLIIGLGMVAMTIVFASRAAAIQRGGRSRNCMSWARDDDLEPRRRQLSR